MRNRFYAFLILLLGSIIIFPVKLTGKNKYIVKVVQPNQIEPPTICSVSVTAENKNQIIWDQTANDNIQYFKIYRDAIDNSGWIFLNKVMYTMSSSYIDATSFPGTRAYEYHISTVDQCGNEFFNRTINKTIKLSVEEISNSGFLLKWNSYQGFNVTGYKIYRGESPENLALIDTTISSATTYTDSLNPNKNAYYQVEAIGNPDDISILKNVSLSIFESRSNIASVKSILSSSDSLDAIKILLYPNPLTTNSVIVFPFDASQKYQLSILDLTGSIVYTKPVYSGEIEIERGNLKEGIYILQVAGEKIFRKKLMVGRI